MKTLMIVIIVLLLFSALLDIFTTILPLKMMKFESNSVIDGKFMIVKIIALKGFIIGALIWFMLYKYSTSGEITRYYVVCLLMLLISLQIIAGINNINVKKNVLSRINDIKEKNNEQKITSISEASEADLERFIPNEGQKAKHYLNFIMMSYVYPFLIAMLSFMLWRKL